MKVPLFGGCYRSDMKVTPQNWQTQKATIKKNGKNKEWRIYYRFYDPKYRNDPKLWGLQVAVRGMNDFHTLPARQDATKTLLEDETEKIDVLGYNPITDQYMAPPVLNKAIVEDVEIPPSTPFLQALEKSLERLDVVKKTRDDIRNILTYVKIVAGLLRYDSMPVNAIRRKHIKSILNYFTKHTIINEKGEPKKWSNNQHNHYLKYLTILFNELDEVEAIEINPCWKIKRKKVVKKIRKTLTKEERVEIGKYLYENYYSFWRFLQIFFHSGARETELVALQVKDVDLVNQQYKVIVRKGGEYVEVIKVIKNIALPFWQEVLQQKRKIKAAGNADAIYVDATPDDYVFSRGLIPGPAPIRADQITKRWDRVVKKKKGVEADVYSLKHSNTTEQVNMLAKIMPISAATQKAAEHNSHTTDKMVKERYDVEFQERQNAEIRALRNAF